MLKPKMFRKRFIPNEIVELKNDEIVYINDEVIITKWQPIKPREDFKSGVSYTFLKEGFKVSRFYDENINLLYLYCDIIEVEKDTANNEYVFIDLLADVKIYNDGKIEVLDIDEIADLLLDGVIDKELAAMALKKLNKLLMNIYRGNFPPEICNDKSFW